MRRWQQVMGALGLVALGAGLASLPQVVRAGEAERKATIELMKVVVPRETYQDMLARMSAAVRDSFVQSGVELVTDFDGRMNAVIGEALPYELLLAWSADLYGAKFTVREIEQIGTFYRQPVGRKLVAELPGISADIMRRTSDTVRTKLPVLLRKHGLLPSEEPEDATPTASP